MLINILFFYSGFLNLSDNIWNQYNMDIEGSGAPGGSLPGGFPGVFRKVHIKAQNYRWNFNCLSADILTNLNKIYAINNSAFFMNLCPTLFDPLRPGYAFE